MFLLYSRVILIRLIYICVPHLLSFKTLQGFPLKQFKISFNDARASKNFPLCSCLEYSTYSPLPTCSPVNLSVHYPSLGCKDKISENSSLYRGVRFSHFHTKQLSGLVQYRPRYQLRPTTSVQPVIRVRHRACLVIRKLMMTYGYHANTTLYD